jgi:hypothetical protein
MPELAHLFIYGTLRRAAGTEWSRFPISVSRFVGMGRRQGVGRRPIRKDLEEHSRY